MHTGPPAAKQRRHKKQAQPNIFNRNDPAFSNASRTRRKQALKPIALNAPNNIKGTIYQWDKGLKPPALAGDGLWILKKWVIPELEVPTE